MAKKARPRRRLRSSVALRGMVVGALLLTAFFYYRPLQAYLSARHELTQREAEVNALSAQHRTLERRLAASTSTGELVKEARRLGLVRPGERLFIVKGIAAWRKAQHPPARSIGAGGARP
jgi:cell division protein FtsB